MIVDLGNQTLAEACINTANTYYIFIPIIIPSYDDAIPPYNITPSSAVADIGSAATA